MEKRNANKTKTYLDAFDAYADALYRHAFFRISDGDRAHDLVQDAFVKTWQYEERGGEILDYRAFLYRAINNLIIDEYRRKKPISLDRILDEDNVPEGNFRELVVESEQALPQGVDHDELSLAMEKLPHQYKTAVTMRYLDELSVQEISDILGVNENIVSIQISRGLKKLRSHLTQNT